MRRLRTILTLAVCLVGSRGILYAQQQPEYEIEALNDQGWAEYSETNHLFRGTNGVRFRFGEAVGTAEEVTMDTQTGDVIADGTVRLQRDDQVWASEHIRYNYRTRQMEAQQFRTGKPPVFASGEGLSADVTNHIFTGTNAFITLDDIANPEIKVRAKYIKIIPGQKIVARQATLLVGDVPVFYFPFFTRNIGPRANNFNFIPGYRTSFGPFVLGSYHFFLNEELNGALHVDYREKRGVGAGPDLHYNLGRWGEGTLRYYYLHDNDP